MSTAYEAADALGIYQTGPQHGATHAPAESFGGILVPVEVAGVDWDFETDHVIPPLVIQHVSAGNGTGRGQLRATGASEIAYTAPGGTEGDPVTIAQGETKIISDGATAAAYARVYREYDDDLGDIMYLLLSRAYNSVIAGPDTTTAGDEVYGAVMLRNRAAANAMTDIKFWLTEGTADIEIALEEPDITGAIQRPADINTAPTGLSFSSPTTDGTALTLASLAAGAQHALWIHRTHPAASSAAIAETVTLHCKFTIDGETYERTYAAHYRVAGTAVFNLYEGVDGAVDFDTPVATESASPIVYALTPPMSGTAEHRLAVRYVNEYGLESVNQDYEPIEIDDTGALVVDPLQTPSNVTLSDIAGGTVQLMADYILGLDSPDANRWRIYWTTDGTDPDPDVDTPIELPMVAIQFLAAVHNLVHQFSALTYGADLRVIVRAFRSSDSAESANTNVVQHTVGTAMPQQPWSRGVLFGESGQFSAATGQAEVDQIFEIDGTSGEAYFRVLPGETQFWADSVLVWRVVWEQNPVIYIPDGWTVTSEAVAGTGIGAPWEVVAWGATHELALIIDGNRRVYIDVDNQTIQWTGRNTFDPPELAAHPSAHEWAHADLSGVTFQIFDPQTGAMQAYMKVDATGTAQMPVDYDRSRA